FGLSEKHFSFILDNDTAKQGERLYGTGLSVRSPRILKGLDSPLVVLKAGQYTQEIKNDILKNINSSTRFIL
ncbi:MAG: class I SAM-dependent methyltransferase, partial [Candidatus Hodarchaeales archaeon]